MPSAELFPWQPPSADVDDWTRDTTLTPVGHDALVVEYDADPPGTQPFYRAAQRAGITSRLFEADRRLEGYGWYDALPRLTDVNARIVIGGATYTDQELHKRAKAPARNGGAPGDCPPSGDCPPPGDCSPPGDRADSILMSAEIARPDGTRDFVEIPADVVFLDTEYGWLSDAYPVFASDSDIGADELADLLRLAYFCASDDSDADSYATQRAQFDAEALRLALNHVASPDEATRTAIAHAVWQDIHWLMPRDRTVHIAIRGNDVFVDLGPLPEA